MDRAAIAPGVATKGDIKYLSDEGQKQQGEFCQPLKQIWLAANLPAPKAQNLSFLCGSTAIFNPSASARRGLQGPLSIFEYQLNG